MKAKSRKPPRNRDLARIHILADALQLPRDVYEAVLWTQGRQDSSAKLDQPGRQKVIAHLEGLLRDTKPGHAALATAAGAAPRNVDTRPEMAKIKALLADAGKPWAYALAIARNQQRGQRVQVDKLEFCSPEQLAYVIAALQKPAIKRLQAELQQLFGHGWERWAGFYAAWLFSFPTGKRDVTKYAEPMSQVLRWYRGELQAACTWPVDLEKPVCCRGCENREAANRTPGL